MALLPLRGKPGQSLRFDPLLGDAAPMAGQPDQNPGLIQAADAIESTVYRTLEFRGRSQDLGGSLGTRELTDAMLMELQNS